MEVYSIFTTNKVIIDLFENFIFNDKELSCVNSDYDTHYFIANDTNRNEIYYHFGANINDHFKYNYSKKELDKIETYFHNEPIYFVSIQFKRKEFLSKFLKRFVVFLNLKNPVQHTPLLFDDPFKGFLTPEEIGEP